VSIRSIYVAWPGYDERLREAIRGMTAEQLAVRPGPEHGSVWQLAAHVAGARVYWLCGILGEPGAEATFLPDPLGDSWEDDEAHPRDADELEFALASSFRVVEACLDRWTVPMLDERFPRATPRGRQWHSRAQLLTRLMTHDAFHAGEISQTRGVLGLTGIELWRADAVDPV
jgi:uncharacterized damage-inducible protein DinB